ncbi:hypothetical protein AUEXF2481DRAFT_38598 [Aureobasidium subglaciale EXF-2481]|uniref:Uncharacterized protein n=1 Tax=Aureobasidium subglaciale (strain EXF-2481) TaxID=1043005 RepID=A0A074ZC97_AURSE|nr:uncharacterized protein AUEXF2481DRAFT_38598 [Aureobasidium subglaciale EXF-2481]KAI5201297.1 hypothetical protein E4T38_06153 [Aureobasidium subglaciale]KAI5219860.1 hypothetical protein E4T40_06174 [Aureobasidium subglaciale]KAI5223633.1 hypothetical protein E4T41_06023 [Aureobasidium subglaciale]KAI5260504.1 hypothetical protein E4T46_05908 [Aureobasidium subglaciale]KEQ96341.1 hypothetical protein AUEXF2481DRAFT_38598 [Aureobasidium subglaciale EXF-2481]
MAAAVVVQTSQDPSAGFDSQYGVVTAGETQAHSVSAGPNSLLVVSPYTSPPHLLDLNGYSTASQLFAKALTIFQPTRADYATADYVESFNFTEVIGALKALAKAEGHTWQKTEFYVVSFRSQLSSDADPVRLFELDSFSHEEAMTSGGLLKYWYGVKNQDRRNLATCFWESRQHARDGGRGPWHAKARTAAGIWYESIVFKTYTLTIEDDLDDWNIKDFEEGR